MLDNTLEKISAHHCTGWWLCKNTTTSAQGWAPSAYVEEVEQQSRAPPPPPPPPVAPARPTPAHAATTLSNGIANGAARNPSPTPPARAKPTPPAPPVKRPTTGARKPLPPPAPARDSAVSLGTGSGTDSGRVTPNSVGGGSLAGGLAEALRARQNAMAGNSKDDDDDW